MLYQLSYLGTPTERRRAVPLIGCVAAVQPIWIDLCARNAISFAQPLQEVAILAAA